MRGRLRKSTVLVLILFTGSLLLTACGQKGPLYLPHKPKTTKVEKEPVVPKASEQEKSSEPAGKTESSGGGK